MMRELALRGGYRIFVVSRRPAEDREALPDGIQAVRYLGHRHLLLLARASHLVTNTMFPPFFEKREGQRIMNTWHGTPLKTLGADMPNALRDIGLTQNQFLMSDYLLFPNDFSRTHLMAAFFLDKLYTGKVLMCGYPRNAPLFHSERRKAVREALGLGDELVYVYMPTWRGESMDTRDTHRHAARLRELLSIMDARLTDGVLVYVKLHPYELDALPQETFRHLRRAPGGGDPYDLLCAADGLISDYSSVVFDFACTGREIILFPYDLGEYRTARGLYLEPDALPFPVATDAERLAWLLNARLSGVRTLQDYPEFMAEYCAEDSADSPHIAVSTFFFEEAAGGARVIDYRENARQVWRILPMQGATEAGAGDEADADDETALPVFSYESFSEAGARRLRGADGKLRPFVVTRGGVPPYGIKEKA
jgi:CDP-glycerol glycerophosphotransferase